VPAGSTSMWASGNFAPIKPMQWTGTLTHLAAIGGSGGNLKDFGVLDVETAQPRSFLGTLDGQGHTISNLVAAVADSIDSRVWAIGYVAIGDGVSLPFAQVVNTPYTANAGLFDTLGSGGLGTVKSLGIVNGWITAPATTDGNIAGGSIAGINNGTIVYSYASGGVVEGGFFDPWIGLFPLSVGLFALALFAFLAAVYLCCETEAAADTALQDDFRRRALGAGVAVGPAALLGGLSAAGEAAHFKDALLHAPWSWPLQIATLPLMVAVGNGFTITVTQLVVSVH